jgi:hypothetical protein
VLGLRRLSVDSYIKNPDQSCRSPGGFVRTWRALVFEAKKANCTAGHHSIYDQALHNPKVFDDLAVRP